MGKVTRVSSLGELRKVLTRDLKARQRELDGARVRAAHKHKFYVMRNMPVAFGELRSSVKSHNGTVTVDAPYAAAVERGSRPHWMPLEPLIKWVKLRGFQGLASEKSLGRMPGSSTRAHAMSVSGELESHRRGSGGIGPATAFSSFSVGSDGQGESSAAVDVAKRIQLAIALGGTKPTWFMRDSIPTARGFLAVEIKAALAKRAGG